MVGLLKKIRRTLPFTTFWGIEAFANEDSGGMFVNLLLDHEHPYFVRQMMRARVILEWHLTTRYFPIKSRVCASKEKRVFLKSRNDAVGSWYPLSDIHAVFREVLYGKSAVSDHEQI